MSGADAVPASTLVPKTKESERELDTQCPVCLRPTNECTDGFRYLAKCLHGICTRCYSGLLEKSEQGSVSCPTCRNIIKGLTCLLCHGDVNGCGMIHRCGAVICDSCCKLKNDFLGCPRCKGPLDHGIKKLVDPDEAEKVVMNMRVHFKEKDEDSTEDGETSLDANFVLCAQFELLLKDTYFTLRATSPEVVIQGAKDGSWRDDFLVTTVMFQIPEFGRCLEPCNESCFLETFSDDDRCRCWWSRHIREKGVARDDRLSLPLRIDFAHADTYNRSAKSLFEDGIAFSCPMDHLPDWPELIGVKFQHGNDPPDGTIARIKRRRGAGGSQQRAVRSRLVTYA